MATGHDQILSPEEQVANEILMEFKIAEMDASFRNLDFPPVRNFLIARDQIEESQVFKILKIMPKGAALHLHDGSGVSTEWIISELTYLDNLYMCYTKDNKFLMRFMSKPNNTTCPWELVRSIRASYPSPEAFDRELLTKLSVFTDKPHEKYPDINAVWEAFERSMVAVNGLVKYLPAWEAYLRRLFLEFSQDNVLYLELRTSLSGFYELDGTKISEEEAISMYKRNSQKFLKDHSQDFFGDRLIYSVHRRLGVDSLWKKVNLAKMLKRSHPDYLKGFDLVGQEDLGPPLKDLLKPLLSLSEGDDPIALFHHSGETNWMGRDSDENLFDSILLNASRIGHGYAITKHPKIKQIAKDRDIPLEVCPVSNQVLMLVSDLRNHPASGLVAEGFPIVISSDGPGLMGSKGLSYDFYEAFMALGGAKADLRFLKQLAINSIRYSTLNGSEKEDLMKKWKGKWDQFIRTVTGMTRDHCQAETKLCP